MSDEFTTTQPEVDLNDLQQETEVQETQLPEGEPTTTPATVETFKVKYNHEEKEIPMEEARQLAQKGMYLEKAIEKTKAETYQQARDAMIAENGYEWMGKPITTEAEYKQALKEKEVYERLQSQALPDEVISEILDSRREREERQTEKQSQAQQQAQQQQYQEFFEYFSAENGRSFDATKDTVPAEVWQAVEKGKTLTDAYIAHENKQLKSKLNIQATNQTNAETSTGSVTGQGVTASKALTADMIEHMTEKEISSRWSEVKKILGMK